MSEIKKLVERIEKEIEEAETVNRSVYKQAKLEGVKEGIEAIKKDVEKIEERLLDYFQVFEEDKLKENYADLKRDYNFVKMMIEELNKTLNEAIGKWKK